MAGVCGWNVAGRPWWAIMARAMGVVTVAGVIVGVAALAIDGGGWRALVRDVFVTWGMMLAPAYAVLAGVGRRGNREGKA